MSAAKELGVYLYGEHVGTLIENGTGRHELHYDDDAGLPPSVSMPRTTAIWRGAR